MARTHQILAGIIPGPRQVSDRFVSGCGRGHLRQQSRPQQLRQLASIAPIRLDVIPGMSAGATTWQLTRSVVSCRCNAYPHGPAS